MGRNACGAGIAHPLAVSEVGPHSQSLSLLGALVAVCRDLHLLLLAFEEV